MKLAYVSVVLYEVGLPSAEKLRKLDKNLSTVCQSHEIIVVVPLSYQPNAHTLSDSLHLNGPLSFILTNENIKYVNPAFAGLGRAVGDFIIEWRGDIEFLDIQTLSSFLNPSDKGFELVEILSLDSPKLANSYLRFVNKFKATNFKINDAIGVVYSRRALQIFLNSSNFEKNNGLIVADISVRREIVWTSIPFGKKESLTQISRKFFDLVSRGTNFGLNLPVFLSIGFGLFAISASVFALGIYIARGKTPEGWVTIMVVLGFSQATVLLLLGLIWNQLKMLQRSFIKDLDPTIDVIVRPPVEP